MENQPYVPPVNKGNLHRNQYKEQENQPDYRGSLNVCGEVAELSGWINTNRNGGKYLGLEIKPPEGYVFQLVPANLESPPSEGPGGPRPGDSSLDEDMPF
jgi:uncharacterized protein (DUF736 family)